MNQKYIHTNCIHNKNDNVYFVVDMSVIMNWYKDKNKSLKYFLQANMKNIANSNHVKCEICLQNFVLIPWKGDKSGTVQHWNTNDRQKLVSLCLVEISFHCVIFIYLCICDCFFFSLVKHPANCLALFSMIVCFWAENTECVCVYICNIQSCNYALICKWVSTLSD